MQKKIVWVGVCPSDITGLDHLFSGVISLLGRIDYKYDFFYSYEEETDVRINHNRSENFEIVDQFILEKIRQIRAQQPDVLFFHQDQLSFSKDMAIPDGTIGNNRPALNVLLSDKIVVRSMVSRFVKTIPGISAMRHECTFNKLRSIFPDGKSYVVQEPHGAGGHNSLVLNGTFDDDRVSESAKDILFASPYMENSIPLNQHIIICENQIVLLPASVQIVQQSDEGALLYVGGDFSAIEMVSADSRIKLDQISEKIGHLLRGNGYRGVAGIDYLLSEEIVYFVEINARFQSSTRLLNASLLAQNLPSVHEMHLKAFQSEKISIPKNIIVSGSFLIGVNNTVHAPQYEDCKNTFKSPDTRDSIFSHDHLSITILTDGLTKETTIEPFARLWKLEVDRQIAYLDHTKGVVIDYAISSYLNKIQPLLSDVAADDIESLARLKFNLFSHGLKISKSALEKLTDEREDLTIRDGIAGGIEIKIFDRLHVNVPIKEYFSLISPFSLDWKKKNGFIISDGFDGFIPIEILPIPDFAGRNVSSGTPMLNIGQMFNERLSVELFFGCINTWANKTACHFCELGAERNPEFISLDDTQELVAHCRDNPKINMRHILLGGGTPPDRMLDQYVEAAKRVRSETNIPLYVMMAPPPNLRILDELKEAGVDEIGFNLEVFDRILAQKTMPAKGKIPLARYFETMEYAVNLWGKAGPVRSIMIVGLEPLENTLKGVKELCKRGVLPILSPYRPVPETPLANHPTPDPELLFQAWKQGEVIANKYGMNLGPTCIACQNNTIAMPYGKKFKYY